MTVACKNCLYTLPLGGIYAVCVLVIEIFLFFLAVINLQFLQLSLA